jgi:predicted AlkP superfamily pyrophosphatase or phosphodiesterase
MLCRMIRRLGFWWAERAARADLKVRTTASLLVLLCSWTVLAQADRHVILITIDGFANFHLKNKAIDLPVIRALARDGVEAESGETVFPSVTHPSHTTLVTGMRPLRHGVINNRYTNRVTGERFHITNLDRTASVKAPTIFDAARRAGLPTASFFWPETRNDPSVDFNVPEVFTSDGKADITAVPAPVLSELRNAGVPIDDYFRYYGNSFLAGTSDAVLAQAAAHAIRTRKPSLLAIHLLLTDEVQHELGPAHYRAHAALSAADHAVGTLVEAVKAAGIADRTTFIVTADHGFATIDKKVNLAPVFADLVKTGAVKVHPQAWSLFVERTAAFDAATNGAALESAYSKALALPGIARLVRSSEFHSLGIPTYDESPYIAGQDFLIGEVDTWLVADASDASTARVPLVPPRHEHGYLPSHPKMFTSLVLSGNGVKKGTTIGRVRSLDVAPTIARLLGVEMANVEGRVLTEALQ